jgi:hypothetical protein
MKNKRLVLIGVVFLVSLIGAASLFAQTTLDLQGTIAQTVNISVTETGFHNNLNLTTLGTNIEVASVTANSNAPGGFEIAIESANASQLKGAALANASNAIDYKLRWGAAGALIAAGASGSGTVLYDGHTTPEVIDGTPETIYLQLETDSSGFFADNFTDTVTFSIVGY